MTVNIIWKNGWLWCHTAHYFCHANMGQYTCGHVLQSERVKPVVGCKKKWASWSCFLSHCLGLSCSFFFFFSSWWRKTWICHTKIGATHVFLFLLLLWHICKLTYCSCVPCDFLPIITLVTANLGSTIVLAPVRWAPLSGPPSSSSMLSCKHACRIDMWERERGWCAQCRRQSAGRYIVQLYAINTRCRRCKVRLRCSWSNVQCNVQLPFFPALIWRE